MDAFTGKYYLQSGKEQEATILLLKDKITIGIRDEHGAPRVVNWDYKQIIRDEFWKRGQAIVRCGSYPVQILEVESKEFAEKLEDIFRQREKSWISRALSKNVMGMMKALTVFFAVLIAFYFWFIPFLAERLAKKAPVSYEEQLGDGLYEALKTGFIIDEKKTAYINDFFRELAISSKYNIRITVVKENIANAFTMPGGNMVVYDKLLEGMNSYEELAAVLSHEFTHINEKHTTRSLFRQSGSSIFLYVIFGDVGTIANTMIRNADRLKGLNYSRNLEKEADLNGLRILSERKIDCNGFINLFVLLEKETKQTVKHTAEWISSHPDLEKRIDYIKKNELFNKSGVEEKEVLKTLFLKLKTAD